MITVEEYTQLRNQLIGRTIAVLREKQHRSQEDIANCLGTTRQRVARIESGEIDLAYPQLELLSKLFGVSVTTLAIPAQVNDGLELLLNQAVAAPLKLDTVIGQPSTTFQLEPAEGVYKQIEISPNNRLAAVVGSKKMGVDLEDFVYLVDLSGNREPVKLELTGYDQISIGRIAVHDNKVAIALVPEGGEDPRHIIEVWKLDRGSWIRYRTLRTNDAGHGLIAQLVLGGPDGNILAAYNEEENEGNFLTVFVLDHQIRYTRFPGFLSAIRTRITISPDGKFLYASGNINNVIYIYTIKGRPVHQIHLPSTASVDSLAVWTKDKRILAAGLGNGWGVWEITGNSCFTLHERAGAAGIEDSQLVVINPNCYLNLRTTWLGLGGMSARKVTTLTNLVTNRTVVLTETQSQDLVEGDIQHPGIGIGSNILVRFEYTGQLSVHPLNPEPLIISSLGISDESENIWMAE